MKEFELKLFDISLRSHQHQLHKYQKELKKKLRNFRKKLAEYTWGYKAVLKVGCFNNYACVLCPALEDCNGLYKEIDICGETDSDVCFRCKGRYKKLNGDQCSIFDKKYIDRQFM